MAISVPQGMDKAEAVRRARALLPCKTGTWEEVDESDGGVLGLMECGDGYYDAHPDGASYGPDDAGVSVEWETP